MTFYGNKKVFTYSKFPAMINERTSLDKKQERNVWIASSEETKYSRDTEKSSSAKKKSEHEKFYVCDKQQAFDSSQIWKKRYFPISYPVLSNDDRICSRVLHDDITIRDENGNLRLNSFVCRSSFDLRDEEKRVHLSKRFRSNRHFTSLYSHFSLFHSKRYWKTFALHVSSTVISNLI